MKPEILIENELELLSLTYRTNEIMLSNKRIWYYNSLFGSNTFTSIPCKEVSGCRISYSINISILILGIGITALGLLGLLVSYYELHYTYLILAYFVILKPFTIIIIGLAFLLYYYFTRKLHLIIASSSMTIKYKLHPDDRKDAEKFIEVLENNLL